MIHRSYGRDSGRCGTFTTAVVQKNITAAVVQKTVTTAELQHYCFLY